MNRKILIAEDDSDMQVSNFDFLLNTMSYRKIALLTGRLILYSTLSL